MPAGRPHITQADDSTRSIIITLLIVIASPATGVGWDAHSARVDAHHDPTAAQSAHVSVRTARLFDSRGMRDTIIALSRGPVADARLMGASQRGDALRRFLRSIGNLKHDHESYLHLDAQHASLMQQSALDLQPHLSGVMDGESSDTLCLKLT
ncbi:hypothetical protein AC579_3837 [Pseudocercospora musae]|uniref:Uncharacterized protein n=1 Tax=Pseudocercospora musae TaxID=113226 RepID=A0A139IS67_9PEZI|nr:hypothetical protein AC579_3837 [Pseudocercospora musae]